MKGREHVIDRERANGSGRVTDAGRSPPLLRIDSVSKRYGDEQALRDVSLSMDARDVEVIVGPSGSGKSTLLRCVNRLTEVDEGSISLDGVDVSTMDVDELRRRVGMVFQDINLFAHLTALGNVTLGPRRVLGLSKSEARERAYRQLEQVGLAGQADSYPAQLSGGQKQRVGIARALAMDPDLVLFDEPTSALDPELIGEVVAVMGDLADGGTTMLVVTHEMGFARSAATRMTFLEGGSIVERGPPEQLFERPERERTRQFLRRITELDGRAETRVGADHLGPEMGTDRPETGADRDVGTNAGASDVDADERPGFDHGGR